MECSRPAAAGSSILYFWYTVASWGLEIIVYYHENLHGGFGGLSCTSSETARNQKDTSLQPEHRCTFWLYWSAMAAIGDLTLNSKP